MVPQQRASFTTKMRVWLEAGSSQAVAPDTTGTFERGSTDLSQAQTSTCRVVNARTTKSLPRQQVSALESVSFADSVPGRGCDPAELAFELMNLADE